MKTIFLLFITQWGSVADWTTVLITCAGIIIALWQFISYRKEIKNKTFIEFRQRFKSDPIIIKILEFITPMEENRNVGNNNLVPSKYDVYHFIGFYEELHKMYIDNQISMQDIVYFFGYYYTKVFDHPDLSRIIKSNSTYWIRAVHLNKLIKKNQNKVLKELIIELKVQKDINILEKEK